MAVLIPVSLGKAYTIVSEEDFEALSKKKWRLSPAGYAMTTIKKQRDGKIYKSTICMHTIINKTPNGMFTDHINGNKLDNRKENLRTATAQQNQMNKKTSKHSEVGLKGIRKCKTTGKWRINMSINGKYTALGRTSCLGKAIKIYNQSAKKYHGEFARLNAREIT